MDSPHAVSHPGASSRRQLGRVATGRQAREDRPHELKATRRLTAGRVASIVATPSPCGRCVRSLPVAVPFHLGQLGHVATAARSARIGHTSKPPRDG